MCCGMVLKQDGHATESLRAHRAVRHDAMA